MSKDLNYYLNLDYTVEIKKERDTETEDIWYIAYTKEIGKYSCYGLGDTPIEAYENLFVQLKEFIKLLYAEGKKIPEPESTKQYSGIFNVRTTPEFHEQLVEYAKKQNVSLNMILNLALQKYITEQDISIELKNELNEIKNAIIHHHKTMQNIYKSNIPENIHLQNNYLIEKTLAS